VARSILESIEVTPRLGASKKCIKIVKPVQLPFAYQVEWATECQGIYSDLC